MYRLDYLTKLESKVLEKGERNFVCSRRRRYRG
ncbi:hypothetical protein [Yersinia frederiksenii]